MRDIENMILSAINVSNLFLLFSALLPKKKQPKASRITQFAKIIPIESSLPEKTINNSRKSSIWAISPLNPMIKIANLRLFLIIPKVMG